MLEVNKIYLGGNIELLKQLEPNSIHSCVSDFPYNLGFMGKKWDTILNYYEWCKLRAEGIYKALKPGGYCLIFGGTRTHHRLVCAFEDAGFEIRDEIMWIYGSGFPKSMDISKAIDKKACAEREVVGKRVHPTLKNVPNVKSSAYHVESLDSDKDMESWDITIPYTEEAKQWDGFGTALKPAHEPIMVARKPLSEKTIANNVLKWGTGGINIDDSRVKTTENLNGGAYSGNIHNKNEDSNWQNTDRTDGKGSGFKGGVGEFVQPEGRFPANIILDEEAGKILDKQTGILKSGDNCTRTKVGSFLEHGGLGKAGDVQKTYGDQGGASRFFYCAKASKKDRTENGLVENKHPTVKPTDLIKYLVRLVTPPNGICLDVCEGSGTHAKACIQLTKEDYPVRYIGFENEEESYNISLERIKANK